MEERNLDLVIIGAGPSGVTAGIYAKRSGLNVALIEANAIGGQTLNSSEIKNFPTITSVSGGDFAYRLFEQINENELEVIYSEVKKVDFSDKMKKVYLNEKILNAKAVILAVGAKVRPLGVEKEDSLTGKGVSYCSICDGSFFKDKIVAITGGGDSALEDSIYLSGVCKKLYVLVRKDAFKGQKILFDGLMNSKKQNKNIEILYNTEVKKLIGDIKLQGIEVFNNKTGEKKVLELDGLFIAIGRIPATDFLKNQIELDSNGYVVVNNKFETNISGVFACGDCIKDSVKQIITACGYGASASTFAHSYIKEKFE